MYRCLNCKKTFDKPLLYETTYEKYFGVVSEFDSYTNMQYEVCPYCENEEFYKVERRVKYEKETNNYNKKYDFSRNRKF